MSVKALCKPCMVGQKVLSYGLAREGLDPPLHPPGRAAPVAFFVGLSHMRTSEKNAGHAVTDQGSSALITQEQGPCPMHPRRSSNRQSTRVVHPSIRTSTFAAGPRATPSVACGVGFRPDMTASSWLDQRRCFEPATDQEHRPWTPAGPVVCHPYAPPDDSTGPARTGGVMCPKMMARKKKDNAIAA